MASTEQSIERLELFALAFDEELTSLQGTIPGMRADLERTLLDRVTRDMGTHAVMLREELARDFAESKVDVATMKAALPDMLANLESELMRRAERVRSEVMACSVEQLMLQAMAMRAELSKAFAGTEAEIKAQITREARGAVETFIGRDMRPEMLRLSQTAAAEVLREYVRVHQEDSRAAARAEMAAVMEIETVQPIGPAPRSSQVNPQTPSFADAFRGEWKRDTSYQRGDIFAFRGSTYLVRTDCRGVLPTLTARQGKNPTYAVLAAAGAPGPRGQDGTGGGGGGSGDVVGPSSAVDGRPALFDGTTGKLIKQASAVLGSAAFTASTAYDAAGAAATVQGNLDAHTGNTSNPHSTTAAQVGLGSVTNDAQTKASVVPNTAPGSGQILVGNGTAYVAVTMGADMTMASNGNATITSKAVSNAKMADMAASTFKMRVTGSTGAPEDGTAAQATAALNALAGDSGSGGTKGLAPAPAAGDAAAGKFLKADATWAVPPSASWVSGLLFTTSASTQNINNSAAETTIFTGTVPGGVLGTQGAVWFVLSGQITNNTGSGQGVTLSVKYGNTPTTLWSATCGATQLGSSTAGRGWSLQGMLWADAATNAQRLMVLIGPITSTTTPAAGYGAWSGSIGANVATGGGTSAIDSTADQALTITAQVTAASSSLTFTTHKASAWKL